MKSKKGFAQGIIILIFIALIIYFGFIRTGSLFYGIAAVECNFVGDIINCADVSGGVLGDEFSGSLPNETITTEIRNPYNLYFKQFENFKTILIANDNNFANFFAVNSETCYFSGGNYRVKAGEPITTPNNNKWIAAGIDSSLTSWSSSWDDGCYGYNGGRYEIHPANIIKSKFPNQLITVEGTICDETSTKCIPFKTYGLCDIVGDGTTGSKCRINAPYVDIAQFPRSHVKINSMIISPKIGGYSSVPIVNPIQTPIIPEILPPSDNPTTPSVECNSNMDCVSICSGKTPTCESGKCYCSGILIQVITQIKSESWLDKIGSFVQGIIDKIFGVFSK